MKALTAAEQRIYDVLADGQPHPMTSLLPCLQDDLGEEVTVRMHISNLRDKISSNGLNVMFFQGRYHLVRMLNHNHE